MHGNLVIISLLLARFATSSPTSVNTRGFTPGRCNLHVTQWYKNKNEVGNAYQFDVCITDTNGTTVGRVIRLPIEDFQSSAITSELPYTVIIGTGVVDTDPVQFAYAGYGFSTSRGCSSVPGAENRTIECGFNC
ncbi:hypothetical protein F5B22DRAFT_641336 [Xylaria bambusicola]|uniref:uncharacterized protein n=1 Tax=Xylaria bambusicola TaxID=326684 RepID=UPI002007B6CC|nr:uncharacterized protein F5B22DRAFT_641336 [Xylaria bambusicola]KAI0526191.1 hypothetical protein F5B22DRAFT_641336 [Xylaria bambusicola]